MHIADGDLGGRRGPRWLNTGVAIPGVEATARRASAPAAGTSFVGGYKTTQLLDVLVQRS